MIVGSRENGLNFELNGAYGDDLPNVGKSIGELTAWISDLDPEKEVEAALEKFETLNAQMGVL